MSKQEHQTTREGGREAAKPLTSGISEERLRPERNSSGNASMAASVLDLRQKVNYILEELVNLAATLGDADLGARVKAYRQTGFRRGR